MGIEYIIVNLDKEEFLDFDPLGFGTKIGAMTSEPIASILSWLLINPEGYGEDAPKMFGSWAGDRIEIIGDEGSGHGRQESTRKEFKDITVETTSGFAEAMPLQRITQLQPMGLIDKDGKVVTDPKTQESVRQYWKEVEAQNKKELDRYLATAEAMEETLRTGTAEQVRLLRCPAAGDALQIQYCETGTEPPYILVKGSTSGFIHRISGLSGKPAWVDVLGQNFMTEPSMQSSENPEEQGKSGLPSESVD